MSASPTTSRTKGATFVVARTARKNPAINGRTLYLTTLDLWTLDIERAQRFTKKEASHIKDRKRTWRIQPVAALSKANAGVQG